MPFSLNKISAVLTTRNVCFAFFIIGFLVFGNMLFNEFVWDDKTFIILNPDVHNPVLPFLFGRNMFNDQVYYRPIPAIYFAILYSFSPVNVLVWHLFQLILHIINTILLYKLFRHFFKNINAFFLSVIFLVHPIQVESVSYIAQTVSPLFFLFGISALLLVMKEKISVKKTLPVMSFLLLLSLLTKETGVIFTVLVNLYSFLYKKKEKMWILLYSVLSVCVYFFMRFQIGHVFFQHTTLIAPIARASLAIRLQSIPEVLFYYLKTVVYPIDLGIEQHWVVTSRNFNTFYFPLFIEMVLGVAIILLGVYCFKVQKTFFRSYIFFVSWFLFALFFHSQIAPLDMTVADRWFYATFVGLLGLVGIMTEILFEKKKATKSMIIIFIIVTIALSIRTVARNRDWVNAIHLYSNDMRIGDNFDLENSLSWEYIQKGDYDNAYLHAKKSIEYWPEWDKNWYNLGVIYNFKGNIPEAQKSYEKALFYNGNYVQVAENLGYLLFYYNKPQAHVYLVSASRNFPQSAKIWMSLALLDYKNKDKINALQEIEKAYKLAPDNATIAQIYASIKNDLPIQFR